MGAYARILLRYLVGALVIKGFIDPDLGDMIVADPDIAIGFEVALGAVIAAGVEVFWRLAKRFGWST